MRSGIGDALSPAMLFALLPTLISIALFVATLTLKPVRRRATLLPPQPRRA